MKRTCTLMALSMMLSGCASFGKPKSDLLGSDQVKSESRLAKILPWARNQSDEPEPYPNPVKLAASWTPDTLTQPGRTPTRGFGARIFFYDEKSRPVPVDGTLVVHAFDESPDAGQSDVKRFEFTKEQFTRHFSRTDLGASYSVWIPWDAVGGSQKRISLVPSFRSVAGNGIQGTPTTVILPGKKPDNEAALDIAMAPQYRQWQLAAKGEANASSGLTTTTIPRPAASMTRTMEAEKEILGPVPSYRLAQGSTPAIDVAMRPADSASTSLASDGPTNQTSPSRNSSGVTRPAAFRLPSK
ncbi:MAG: hypothetical protein AAGD07_21120 [Planctomycetota bacterium]